MGEILWTVWMYGMATLAAGSAMTLMAVGAAYIFAPTEIEVDEYYYA